MAEYIDKEKLINRLHIAEENYKADHDYDIDNDPFSDGILSAMFSVNQIISSESTADVVEREKIDKAIEEMKALANPQNKILGFDEKMGLKTAMNILVRNIGGGK